MLKRSLLLLILMQVETLFAQSIKVQPYVQFIDASSVWSCVPSSVDNAAIIARLKAEYELLSAREGRHVAVAKERRVYLNSQNVIVEKNTSSVKVHSEGSNWIKVERQWQENGLECLHVQDRMIEMVDKM